MKVKINDKATDTWLEPYIGFEFEVDCHGRGKTTIVFDQHFPTELIDVDSKVLDVVEEGIGLIYDGAKWVVN